MDQFDISGFDPSTKRPIMAAQINFGAGRLSQPGNRCLLVGMALAAAVIATNAAPIRITSEGDVETLCGAGSQLATMAYTAFAEAQGQPIDLWVSAVPEPSGTKATVTLTPTASQTTPGTIYCWVAGISTALNVSASDTADTWGANAVIAINANPRLPVTAAYATGVLTLSVKNKGIQGKLWQCYLDMSQAPTGFTVAIAGSATNGTNRVWFGATSSGTGTEDVTTVLTAIAGTRWARIAVGQNDSTNLGLWKTAIAAEAAPQKARFEHYHVGHNGSASAAISIAQTTLNDQRAHLRWARSLEAHPSQIATASAARAAFTELNNPNPNYIGATYRSLPPQRLVTDAPTEAEQEAALANSVSPLNTVDNVLKEVRAICTHSLTSGNADYRTFDDGDSVFPDYAMYALKARWIEYSDPVNGNPRVGPDSNPEPPSGVAHPATWNDELFAEMTIWWQNGWIQDPPSTPDNPTTSTYGTVYVKQAKRLQSGIAFIVRPPNAQLGQTVNQVAA